MAAHVGRTEVVSLLLDAGADIEAKDRDGSTPLQVAAWQGHANVVRLLLAAGADIDSLDSADWTPLHWVALEGHREVAMALINAGAAIDSRAKRTGSTALHIAAGRGEQDIVALLLAAGTDPTLRRRKNARRRSSGRHIGNQTARDEAVFRGHTAIVALIDAARAERGLPRPGTPADPKPVTVCLEPGDDHVSDLALRPLGARDRWPESVRLNGRKAGESVTPWRSDHRRLCPPAAPVMGPDPRVRSPV